MSGIEELSGVCVRLVVPDVPDDTDAAADAVDYAIGLIVRKWGGCTAWRAVGYWDPRSSESHDPTESDEDDTIVMKDPIVVIETSMSEQSYRDSGSWWEQLARQVRTATGETCVYVSVRRESACLIYGDDVKGIGYPAVWARALGPEPEAGGEGGRQGGRQL